MPNFHDTRDSRDFAAEHAAWHAEVETGRTSPHGPLSITALHWLAEEPQRFEDVPGAWHMERESGVVTARFSGDEGVSRDGAPLAGTVEFEALTELDTLTLEWGAKRIELAARSGGIALRPRDPSSPDRLGYTGTATFPATPDWVVRARFTPEEREAVEVSSAAGETATQRYDSPGTAEFEVDGQTVRLTLFGAAGEDSLRAIFADRTGEDLTFPAARFVSATRVGENAVEIDFNRTTNLPCAYSASATCPFPPSENRLPVRIEAGELRPGVVLPHL